MNFRLGFTIIGIVSLSGAIAISAIGQWDNRQIWALIVGILSIVILNSMAKEKRNGEN